MSVRVEQKDLKKVHSLLAKDVGGVHSIFVAGQKVLTPSIETVGADLSEKHGFSGDERIACVYLVSLAKTRGSETADFQAFTGILRRPCPKAPPNGTVFLPYLSFLCNPDRRAFVKRDSVTGKCDHSDDVVVKPHPTHIELPPPPTRNAASELTQLLQKESDSINFTTFSHIMSEVDSGISRLDSKRLFADAAIKVIGERPSDRTLLPATVLLEVSKPHLTMVRQKTRSSTQVQGAMNWPVPEVPISRGGGTPRGAKGSSAGAGAGGGNSARSGSISPRTGGKPTKSALLRLSQSKDAQQNPNSPFFKGDYRHIPVVPESHFKKQAKLGLTSQYSGRKPSSGHAAAEAGGVAEEDTAHTEVAPHDATHDAEVAATPDHEDYQYKE